jgi:hypothetical protein
MGDRSKGVAKPSLPTKKICKTLIRRSIPWCTLTGTERASTQFSTSTARGFSTSATALVPLSGDVIKVQWHEILFSYLFSPKTTYTFLTLELVTSEHPYLENTPSQVM